jgi:spore germination protein GerM
MKCMLEPPALLVALTAAAGVTLGACHQPTVGGQSTKAPAAAKHEPTSPPATPSAGPDAETEARVSFTLYFANREYVETGNDRLDRLVAEPVALEPVTAAGGNDSLAAALLQALGGGPTSAAALPVIPARIQIRSVQVREGVAELDLAREGLSGGSLEEQLFVASIVRTLTQLPEVRAVRFLVEGKPTETLMGHVSTAQPLSTPD